LLTKFDVVVCGGGAAGLTLANLLADMSGGALRIALVDTKLESRKHGPRTSAIAIGPKQMLASMGAWSLESAFAAPVRRIEVSDAQESVEAIVPDLTFQCAEYDEALAWIIRHSELETHLRDIARSRDIRFIEGEIVGYKPNGAFAQIELRDGGALGARLVVAADGAQSRLRELAKVQCVEWGYDRSAIVATLRHEESHADTAVQIFYPAGPFATLPLTGNRSSLVWTETRDRAERLRRSDINELTAEIQRYSADRLGSLRLEGDIASFALGYSHVRSFHAERLVFIGDAARRVHPLAGQGLNLGLRDAAALSEIIIESARLGLDFGSISPLVEYGRRRNLDSVISSSAFDVLHRIFAWDASALRMARKTGLSLVQSSDHIKALLMKEATGFSGMYPERFGREHAIR
jgi:2-octaprenyl-6-methoxyphenol hydroxylase